MTNTIEYPDLLYTGPGTPAGRYMRRFWQPIGAASDLPSGRAKPLRILGEQFTLYRGEGGVPHVVADRCAHRGTQLSTGWVEGDCIRCFYHGWKYDGAGQCVEQPAEDGGFAQKVHIDSYPTQEYLGLIFAYFGEGAPPPLPRLPEFEDETGVVHATSYVRECNVWNNLDNDPYHVAWVHRHSHIYEPDPEVLSCEETDYGTRYVIASSRGRRVNARLMPNAVLFYVPAVKGRSKGTFHAAWRVPINDERHQTCFLEFSFLTPEEAEQNRQDRAETAARTAAAEPRMEVVRKILRGELHINDAEVIAHPSYVNIQDEVSQIGQGAIPDWEHEHLGRSDITVIAGRKLWLREVRAMMAGEPLKEWKWKPGDLDWTDTEAGWDQTFPELALPRLATG